MVENDGHSTEMLCNAAWQLTRLKALVASTKEGQFVYRHHRKWIS